VSANEVEFSTKDLIRIPGKEPLKALFQAENTCADLFVTKTGHTGKTKY